LATNPLKVLPGLTVPPAKAMTPPPEVHSLVYASASVAPMKPPELTRLLLKARENNKRLGLSGMLVHQRGSFLQTLEGNLEVVERLFELISRDKRHAKIVVLSRGTVPARSFGDWTMGFLEGESKELERLGGFNDFFRKGFELARISENPGRARDLFLAFREGRFRQFVDV
jgi:hypothetical protein